MSRRAVVLLILAMAALLPAFLSFRATSYGFGFQIPVVLAQSIYSNSCPFNTVPIIGPYTITQDNTTGLYIYNYCVDNFGNVIYTGPSVFSNTQMNISKSANINNLNFQTEFQIAQGANYSTDGFAAGVNVPSSSTVYQVNGISGYVALGSTATHAGVGGNFICNAKLNGVNCFGSNPVAEDVAGLTANVILTGTEVDTGAQGPITAYSGLFGVTSVIGGTAVNWTAGTRVGGSAAFKAGSNAVSPYNRRWAFGYVTQDQSVTDAAYVSGALCTSGSCNSQGILFNAFNSSVQTQATITSSNTGSILMSPATGAVVQSSSPIGGSATAFANLPSCTSGIEGTMRGVTDSTVNTWGTNIAGGGANHVLAYCNGTAWTVAAK